MIPYFRKIRNLPASKAGKMANKNKPLKPAWPAGRYLRYAIGEIFLVVIGILIALQINNWNENRKERILEKQILTDIKKSLTADLKNQLGPNKEQLEKDLSNINTLIKTYQNNWQHQDSLKSKYRSLMYSKAFKWEVTAYKNLENEGLDIISDQELKEKILRLYNMSYPEMETFIGNFSKNLMEFYRPDMRLNFSFQYEGENNYYTPLDYEALLNNPVFMNTLLSARINFQNIFNHTNYTILQVNAVIKSIEKELNP